ncbi:MAG: hydroxymethylglutaryl-CoA lyase [Gammaproteobacteria bacterium]|jgi:hydroxymethylglutaryl-CoA lyase|nr:hydroxymethylglutaryl-CoA lyase [Gammaproteobacteria bacterium]MBT5202131.1 hydroxymethylglutaryl-CoA lyase [Gammaproteobacteria bacterium]MBT5600829.1 hydroxymethylglutaryl-CoA lyase [Gammaproteobacteria bacterium]MBT6246205.1 hydroxymethylglutaryl-CoA lyase [Gammaproteobacteria bacterium]
MPEPDILVSEVGPRDGLQNIDAVLPTEAKKRWIQLEAEAGVTEIEVGSFVPAKYMPQLADTLELVSFARAIKGLSVAVLVPNFYGAKAAVEAQADKMSIPFSVSETHCQRNLNRSHDQMFAEIDQIVDMLSLLPKEKRPHFEVGLSTAFGCSLEGKIADEKIAEIAEKVIAAGCDEVGLSDTTGSANPAQVRHLIKLVRSVVGNDKLTGVHLHNTRGLGLANALAALEEGITTLDSSLGGLGGCPAAPGASGNIVTEDLVFMLESMGLNTGIDIHKLLSVRQTLSETIAGESLFGFTAEAGLPKGY